MDHRPNRRAEAKWTKYIKEKVELVSYLEFGKKQISLGCQKCKVLLKIRTKNKNISLKCKAFAFSRHW